MNIEHIAAEVAKELLSEIYLDQASGSPNVPYSRILIVCGKTDLDLEPILAKLSKWKEKAQFTIIAPKWAQNLWGSGVFQKVGLSAEYLSFDSPSDKAKALLGQVDRVAVVGITSTLMNKISRANQDNLLSSVVIEALGRNKPVMILDRESHAFSQSKKVQSMGVKLGTLNDLEHVFPLPPVPQLSISNAVRQAKPAGGNMPGSCQSCDLHGQCASLCTDRVRQMVAAGAERVGTALGLHSVPNDLAQYIDHTLLKADSTESQVRQLCAEAREYNFASVCINPSWVSLSRDLLKGCPVMVCTVIGFPLGATDSQTKAAETRYAISNGADEIDMVINVGALKSQQLQKVESDIRGVVQAAQGKTVKVILETALLSDAEKLLACQLSEKAGAHFVKTSTGFGPSGATEEDIALMRRSVKPEMEVKASGGIRDQEKALKMVRAGATRIGASASIAIVTGKDAGAGKY